MILTGFGMEDFTKYNGEGTTLRKAQLRMLDMLVALDSICRKHNIAYWIDFGTLLGAVRHKGFIPWDDDIDVSILESDMGKLRKALQEDLPSNFAFQDYTVDSNAFFPYARIRDKKSYCYYPHFVKLKEQGLWLDIFKYSVIVNNSFKIFVDKLYRRSFREIHNYGEVEYESKFKRMKNKYLGYLLHPFSVSLKFINSELGKLKAKKRIYGCYSSTDHQFYHENIFPLQQIEFEGHMFYAPGNFDAHLKGLYGDYMKVPPVEKRKQILDLDRIEFYE